MSNNTEQKMNTVDKAAETRIKWATLENEAGTGTMSQHGYVEHGSGNKSLCGRFSATDGNEKFLPWIRIEAEPKRFSACRTCSKVALRISAP